MVDLEGYRELLEYIKVAHEVGGTPEGGQSWLEAGAGLINHLSHMTLKPEFANSITPNSLSKDNDCILSAILLVLENLPDINAKISKQIWAGLPDVSDELISSDLSFYELAVSRCALFIFQLTGGKISYVQKILLKYVFGDASVDTSIFASDLYTLLVRAAPLERKDQMVSIVLNMCKIAPAKPRSRGIALVKRLKHPTINFENPSYRHILDMEGEAYQLDPATKKPLTKKQNVK